MRREEENKWLDGQMDRKLAGTKGGQGSDRQGGKEMKGEEERSRSEQKSPELFYRQWWEYNKS